MPVILFFLYWSIRFVLADSSILKQFKLAKTAITEQKAKIMKYALCSKYSEKFSLSRQNPEKFPKSPTAI